MGLLEDLKKKQRFERTALSLDALSAAYYAVLRAFRREKNTVRETEAEWTVKVLAGALALAEAKAAAEGASREKLRELRADGEELGLVAHAPGVVDMVRPCFVCGMCQRMPPQIAGFICDDCKEDFREIMGTSLGRLLDAPPDDDGSGG